MVLASAAGPTTSIAASITCLRTRERISRANLPVMIRETSKMPSMSFAWWVKKDRPDYRVTNVKSKSRPKIHFL